MGRIEGDVSRDEWNLMVRCVEEWCADRHEHRYSHQDCAVWGLVRRLRWGACEAEGMREALRVIYDGIWPGVAGPEAEEPPYK